MRVWPQVDLAHSRGWPHTQEYRQHLWVKKIQTKTIKDVKLGRYGLGGGSGRRWTDDYAGNTMYEILEEFQTKCIRKFSKNFNTENVRKGK